MLFLKYRSDSSFALLQAWAQGMKKSVDLVFNPVGCVVGDEKFNSRRVSLENEKVEAWRMMYPSKEAWAKKKKKKVKVLKAFQFKTFL